MTASLARDWRYFERHPHRSLLSYVVLSDHANGSVPPSPCSMMCIVWYFTVVFLRYTEKDCCYGVDLAVEHFPTPEKCAWRCLTATGCTAFCEQGRYNTVYTEKLPLWPARHDARQYGSLKPVASPKKCKADTCMALLWTLWGTYHTLKINLPIKVNACT